MLDGTHMLVAVLIAQIDQAQGLVEIPGARLLIRRYIREKLESEFHYFQLQTLPVPNNTAGA